MMSITPRTGSATVISTTKLDFEYFEINKKVFAFRFTQSCTNDRDGEEKATVVSEQGLCDRKGLTALRKGVWPRQITMVLGYDPETFEQLQRFGYWMLHGSRRGTTLPSENPYDFLINGGNPEHLVRVDPCDYSTWRLDGTLLPTGMIFDSEARMNGEHYDMTKAAAILTERDDVTFVMRNHGYRPLTEIILPDNPPGGHMSFVWTPNQEQAELLHANRSTRYNLVFEHDMLGLRAGGAALHDTFYAPEREREREECHCHCSCNCY